MDFGSGALIVVVILCIYVVGALALFWPRDEPEPPSVEAGHLPGADDDDTAKFEVPDYVEWD